MDPSTHSDPVFFVTNGCFARWLPETEMEEGKEVARVTQVLDAPVTYYSVYR